MSIAPKSGAALPCQESATVSNLKPAQPWESREWQKAVLQNPDLSPFFKNLESFANLPDGVEKLRELLLELAVRGKLVEQADEDEDASELAARLSIEKKRLIQLGKLKKTRSAGPITGAEIPYPCPSGWVWARLNDVYDVRDGTHDTPIYVAEGIPLLTSKNISGGKLDFRNVKFISQADHDDISIRSGVDRFDILFAMIGSIGNPVIVDTERPFSAKNVAIFKYYSIKESCPQYLCLFLKNAERKMRREAAGGVQSFVSLTYLRKYLVPLPPLAEQRRIVAKVESLMSLCDRLESYRRERESVRERASRSVLASLTSASAQPPAKQKASSGVPRTETLASAWQRLSDHFEVLLDQPENVPHLRQAILQLAVQGKLVPQDPADEPANVLIAEIANRKQELVAAKKIAKPKKLPPINSDETPFDLPNGWEWLRLESVCEIITKGSSPKWQGVSYLENADGGILFITSENVGNYVMRKMDTPKYVEEKFNEMEPRSILQREDILVNLVGASIGRSAIWDRDDVANINQAVGIVRLVPGCRTLNRRYLLDYLNSPTCLEIMLGNRVTTAQPNISLTNVKHFPIPTPPEAEQKRIVSKVSVLLSQCDELTARLRSRQSTTDALLTALIHQVLNGADGDQ